MILLPPNITATDDPDLSTDENLSGQFFNFTDTEVNVTNTTVENSSSSTDIETLVDDGSIIAKISLLLVVTAVVLIASYKFVVRLFLGYADRKDEVVPDDFSDDDDSAVVKRDTGPCEDMGPFG